MPSADKGSTSTGVQSVKRISRCAKFEVHYTHVARRKRSFRPDLEMAFQSLQIQCHRHNMLYEANFNDYHRTIMQACTQVHFLRALLHESYCFQKTLLNQGSTLPDAQCCAASATGETLPDLRRMYLELSTEVDKEMSDQQVNNYTQLLGNLQRLDMFSPGLGKRFVASRL